MGWEAAIFVAMSSTLKLINKQASHMPEMRGPMFANISLSFIKPTQQEFEHDHN